MFPHSALSKCPLVLHVGTYARAHLSASGHILPDPGTAAYAALATRLLRNARGVKPANISIQRQYDMPRRLRINALASRSFSVACPDEAARRPGRGSLHLFLRPLVKEAAHVGRCGSRLRRKPIVSFD